MSCWAYAGLAMTVVAGVLAVRFVAVSWPRAVAGTAMVIALEITFILTYNPLPADEKIISLLQQNRKKFESLVAAFRENVGVRGHGLDEATLRALGIDYVYELDGFWVVVPSTTQFTARLRDEMTAPRSARVNLARISTLGIQFSPPGRYRKIWPWRGGIWKDLVNFPQSPEVNGAELLTPKDPDGRSRNLGRLVESLNWYLAWLGRYECIYRRVDSKWYLRMCRAR